METEQLPQSPMSSQSKIHLSELVANEPDLDRTNAEAIKSALEDPLTSLAEVERYLRKNMSVHKKEVYLASLSEMDTRFKRADYYVDQTKAEEDYI